MPVAVVVIARRAVVALAAPTSSPSRLFGLGVGGICPRRLLRLAVVLVGLLATGLLLDQLLLGEDFAEAAFFVGHGEDSGAGSMTADEWISIDPFDER